MATETAASAPNPSLPGPRGPFRPCVTVLRGLPTKSGQRGACAGVPCFFLALRLKRPDPPFSSWRGHCGRGLRRSAARRVDGRPGRKCLEPLQLQFPFVLRTPFPVLALYEPYAHRSISACPHASSELKGPSFLFFPYAIYGRTPHRRSCVARWTASLSSPLSPGSAAPGNGCPRRGHPSILAPSRSTHDGFRVTRPL